MLVLKKKKKKGSISSNSFIDLFCNKFSIITPIPYALPNFIIDNLLYSANTF